MFRAFFETGQEPHDETRQSRLNVLLKSDEMRLIELEKNWTNIHRSVTHQWKKTRAIGEEVGRKARRSNAFEDDVVCLEDSQMNSARQRWMKALCQALADCHFFRNHWISNVAAKHLKENEHRQSYFRPLARNTK